MSKNYYVQNELKEIGFTKSLINKYLPNPDKTEKNKHSKKKPIKLFLAERVHSIQQSEEFKNDLNGLKNRKNSATIASSKTIKTKQQRIVKFANSLNIRINNTKKITDLIDEALDDRYNYILEREGIHSKRLKDFSSFDDEYKLRRTANYIKYNYSNYSSLTNEVEGKVGIGIAILIIEKKFYIELGSVYPSLKEYCDDELEKMSCPTLAYEETPPNEKISRELYIGDLDRDGIVKVRQEQARLKSLLTNGKPEGQCCFCHKIYPTDFLRCAHIKKRSECLDEEKININVVMLNCPICDSLYEQGYIGVENGSVITLRKERIAKDLLNLITDIEGNICLIYSTKNSHFFSWHIEFHTQSILSGKRKTRQI
ncbi:hypothetical protein [Chitinophaga japonensis]|uniref:HNH endonuclease n=1 Tax=Chitinophaga japonensis TaxID=104662 RepID=A0A562TCK9_CHIJA|nr:hypothetical protein [Chitinophaga japonensis]TWI91297.1 hypothetical protein LX66_0663 [Chitinophaga japonensis]